MKNKQFVISTIIFAGLILGFASSASAYTSPTSEKLFYSNASAHDFSGNSNHGKLEGSPQPGIATGVSNSSGEWDLDSDSSFEAYDFSGISSDNQSVYTKDIDFRGSYTVTFWAKSDSTSQAEFTGLAGTVYQEVGGTRDGDDSWQIGFDSSGNYRINEQNKHTIQAASTDWTHFAVTYNDSQNDLKVYADGELKVDVNSPTNKIQYPVFGTNRGGGEHFDGKMDEIHIYRDRVLTSQEVENNKNYNQLTEPGTNSEPSINTVQYEVSSSWVSSGSLSFNDQVTRIRANITDPDGDSISSTSLTLEDLYDSNTRVSSASHTSASGDYYVFDITDQTLDDSGNWETTIEATDSNSNTVSNTDSWSLPWGTLSATLDKPSTDIQVSQYETFNMTGTATCSGGECSSEGEKVEVWADPAPVEGSVKLASEKGQVLPGDKVDIKSRLEAEGVEPKNSENLLDKILALAKVF